MPRNSSGTMTLPAPGVPFQSGQTISSAQVNATLTDLATEVGSSLDRSGRGGALAPIRGVDGTVAAPALAFTGEPASGLYRAAANDIRLAVGGVDALKLVAGGVAELDVPTTPSAVVKATGAGAQLWLQGNRTAADTFADVVVIPTVARTAGVAFQIWNGPTASPVAQLSIDYHGLLKLEQPATALQPASLWTALVPDSPHTAASGLAYWKDAGGMVHVKGVVVSGSTISGSMNLVTTTPLPAGFRPIAARHFGISVSGNPGVATVGTVGNITFLGAVNTGNSIWLDSIHFLAEA